MVVAQSTASEPEPLDAADSTDDPARRRLSLLLVTLLATSVLAFGMTPQSVANESSAMLGWRVLRVPESTMAIEPPATASRTAEAQTTQAQTAEARTTAAQVTETQAADAQAAASGITEARITEAQITEAQITEVPATEALASEAQRSAAPPSAAQAPIPQLSALHPSVPQAIRAEEPVRKLPVRKQLFASRAEKLKHDVVQRAGVPAPRSARPQGPLRLSPEQQRIARHISRTYRVSPNNIEPIVAHAWNVAADHELEPHLLLAVMAVESSFNPFAESRAGAQGLMQVMTRVHKERFTPFGGVDAAWDPFANIKVGAGILAEYVARYGDVAGGLKAYVGAAFLRTDRGYGSKVLAHRDAFEAVARGEAPARRATSATARNDYNNGAAPAALGL